jgi:NADH-quinone oxidoreductase subunit J
MFPLAQSSLPSAADPGPLPLILFFLFAALTVLPAFAVAFAKNIVRAAVALLFSLMGVAGLYLLLHAEFLAAVQLVVYVGGTLILMIFGIMLTSGAAPHTYRPRIAEIVWAVAIALALSFPLLTLAFRVPWNTHPLALTGPAATRPSVEDLGLALLDPHAYLLPFELLSILLLAVMIGAAYLAKSRRPATSPKLATPLDSRLAANAPTQRI